MSVQEASERLRQGEGALIVELTAPGFPTFQFWWTNQPEAFLTVPETCPDDRMDPIEEELNFNHFLDEDTGCAKLLPITYYGWETGRFTEEQTGFRTSLWIRSFWVYAERHRKKRRPSP